MQKYALTLPNDTPRPYDYCHLPDIESNYVLCEAKKTCIHEMDYIYRVSQEECARLRNGVPCVKVYRYNPKHVCPKLNGYGDNGQRSLKL